jgi:diguanylate cyclase (GGDEF)-like protein
LRDTDQVARLGGDEFVVALGNPVSPGVVERLAERIQASVSRPIHLKQGLQMVTVLASIGAEIGPRDIAQSTTLRLADDAMYRAKRERQTA